jgi:uncharacterized damage-inducible protein DinB
VDGRLPAGPRFGPLTARENNWQRPEEPAMLAAMTNQAGPEHHPAAPEDLPPRQFAWWDVFVAPADDPREEGGVPDGERATLLMYLRNRRLTLELKCADLDPAAMACRSVPPSNLSLLGLVRHLAGVEQYWFRIVLAGQDVPRRYRTQAGQNLDFDGAVADADVVAEAWEAWRTEVAFASQFVAESADLGVTASFDQGVGDELTTISLREVLVHLIEEYARHLGHADFLRERIDGRVGQ